MARQEEIERKFLVRRERLPPLPPGARIVQGYLGFSPTVRVRCQTDPDGARRAFLTIKGEGLIGRDEFEYEIPPEEAEALLRLARGAPVEKTRHRLKVPGEEDLVWEIDLFTGENEGLAVAEIELPDPDTPFPRPDWLGPDVTEDPAYKNASLAQRPYRSWASR